MPNVVPLKPTDEMLEAWKEIQALVQKGNPRSHAHELLRAALRVSMAVEKASGRPPPGLKEVK
jgi:hypothetical protein